MARKLFKRFTPPREVLQNHKYLKPLGSWLNNENLWHINRYSASMAVLVGLFVAFLPIPMQMLVAACAAIYLHCNLPISVALVWVSNPVTMVPIWYACYQLGAFLLDAPVREVDLDMSVHGLGEEFLKIWKPLWTGCLISGVFFGSLGYWAVRVLWRVHVQWKWHKRKK